MRGKRTLATGRSGDRRAVEAPLDAPRTRAERAPRYSRLRTPPPKRRADWRQPRSRMPEHLRRGASIPVRLGTCSLARVLRSNASICAEAGDQLSDEFGTLLNCSGRGLGPERAAQRSRSLAFMLKLSGKRQQPTCWPYGPRALSLNEKQQKAPQTDALRVSESTSGSRDHMMASATCPVISPMASISSCVGMPTVRWRNARTSR